MRLIILATLFMATAIGSSLAAPSSFQRSCSNIDLNLESNNAWIVADCGDGSGRDRPAEIAIRGIYNDHGRLRLGNDFSSSFQRSCRDVVLDVNQNDVGIVATCGDGNGGEIRDSISIQNIHNRNGTLVYN